MGNTECYGARKQDGVQSQEPLLGQNVAPEPNLPPEGDFVLLQVRKMESEWEAIKEETPFDVKKAIALNSRLRQLKDMVSNFSKSYPSQMAETVSKFSELAIEIPNRVDTHLIDRKAVTSTNQPQATTTSTNTSEASNPTNPLESAQTMDDLPPEAVVLKTAMEGIKRDFGDADEMHLAVKLGRELRTRIKELKPKVAECTNLYPEDPKVAQLVDDFNLLASAVVSKTNELVEKYRAELKGIR